MIHDDCGSRRDSHGVHKAVTAHHSQEEVTQPAKVWKKYIWVTAFIGGNFVLCLDGWHLWDGGGEAEMSTKDRLKKEEIHGGVEVGVLADSQDDEQVSKHSDQVHE